AKAAEALASGGPTAWKGRLLSRPSSCLFLLTGCVIKNFRPAKGRALRPLLQRRHNARRGGAAVIWAFCPGRLLAERRAERRFYRCADAGLIRLAAQHIGADDAPFLPRANVYGRHAEGGRLYHTGRG